MFFCYSPVQSPLPHLLVLQQDVPAGNISREKMCVPIFFVAKKKGGGGVLRSPERVSAHVEEGYG